MSAISVVQLELENFKSYRGKQIIGPFIHNFTSVIGPNGSGKSNVMDAICFVLGVPTTTMRGAALEDFVYREGDSRAADGCAVTMVLNHEGAQHVFRRSVVSSGRGGGWTSEYRVDGKKSSPADYNERLARLNVDVNTKNFLVFQGDVSNIGGGGANSLALTRLFEEVSGSHELEAEYEELRVQKEKAEETAVVNFQRKRGLDMEKKQFKDQESEANRYRELLQTASDTRKEQMVLEVYFVKTQLGDLDAERETVEAKVDELAAGLRVTEEELAAAQKELGSAKRARMQQDTAYAAKLKEHMTMNPSVIELRKEAEHLNKKIERGQEKERALQREVDTQKSDLADLERQLHEIQRVRKDWEATVKRQQEQKAVALDEQQLEKYNALKEKATQATMEDQNRLNELRSRQLLKKEELGALSAKEGSLKARKADLEHDIRSLQSRLTQQRAASDEAKQKMAELEQAVADKEKRKAHATKTRDTMTEQLATLQGELREEKLERKQTEREARFVQTVDSLKRLYPGVRGRLSDLVEMRQAKYRVAAVVALGRHMDSVVVDDRATAIECLQYMKSQKLGVATFLPLDSIHPKPLLERLRNLGGSAKLVADVVSSDDAGVTKAVLYAVGNTLVCDTEREAKELAFGRERQKSVTITGTVVHKSGVMSGGQTNAAQAAAKRLNNKKFEELKKKRDTMLEQLEKVSVELRSLNAADEGEKLQIVQLQARVTAVSVDIKQLEAKVSAAEGELRVVDKELKTLAPTLKAAQTELEARDKETVAAEKSVNATEDKIFAAFSASVGVRNIRQYEQEAVTMARHHNEHRAQLAAQESRISSALSYAQSRDLDAPRKDIVDEIKAFQKQLAAVQKKLAGLGKQEDSLLRELESLKAKNKELKETESKAMAVVKATRKRFSDSTEEMSKAEKTLAEVRGKIRVLQSRRHAVLRRATVEEIELPYAHGAQFKEPSNTQSQLEVFEAEDELDFDFSGLRRELRNVRSEAEFVRENAKLEDELQAVNLELVRMNPNLKAVEKLKEVNKKAETMEKDFRQARDENSTVLQQFKECRDKRVALFMKCFSFVQKNIEQIYDALTRSSKMVGGMPAPGGKAFLTVGDPNEPWRAPITYQTIPPSKRMWHFEQLSGGEKTLASLALIFAIQAYKPAPFFVLDEIDAALDSQNVEKVCRYISEHSKKCQFIVISLKDAFFSQADALIGVFKDNRGECSGTLSIDLTSRQ